MKMVQIADGMKATKDGVLFSCAGSVSGERVRHRRESPLEGRLRVYARAKSPHRSATRIVGLTQPWIPSGEARTYPNVILTSLPSTYRDTYSAQAAILSEYAQQQLYRAQCFPFSTLIHAGNRISGRITHNSRLPSRQLANPHIDIMESQSTDQNQGVRARLVIQSTRHCACVLFLLDNQSVLRIPVIAMVTRSSTAARQSSSSQGRMPII